MIVGAASRRQGGSKRPSPTSVADSSTHTTGDASGDGEVVVFPEAFNCDTKTIKVAKGATVNVSMYFLPFQSGEYTAEVVLIDEKVGEMLIELKGRAKVPEITESFKFQCKEGTSMEKEINLPARNSQLERARSLLTEHLSGHAKVSLTFGLCRKSLLKKIWCFATGSSQGEFKTFHSTQPGCVQYRVIIALL